MKKVGIVMGSDSDLPVVRKAADTLEALHISYEMHIFSAHRTPDEAAAFAANARRNGFGVLIAAAGMAAHLAGALAARTTLPVIGIPCKSSCFDGMDPPYCLPRYWLSAIRSLPPRWTSAAHGRRQQRWKRTPLCSPAHSRRAEYNRCSMQSAVATPND